MAASNDTQLTEPRACDLNSSRRWCNTLWHGYSRSIIAYRSHLEYIVHQERLNPVEEELGVKFDPVVWKTAMLHLGTELRHASYIYS